MTFAAPNKSIEQLKPFLTLPHPHGSSTQPQHLISRPKTPQESGIVNPQSSRTQSLTPDRGWIMSIQYLFKERLREGQTPFTDRSRPTRDDRSRHRGSPSTRCSGFLGNTKPASPASGRARPSPDPRPTKAR